MNRLFLIFSASAILLAGCSSIEDEPDKKKEEVSARKKKSSVRKKDKWWLEDYYAEKEEAKRRFMDMNHSLSREDTSPFPWRRGGSRSEQLQEEIRSDRAKDPLWNF